MLFFDYIILGFFYILDNTLYISSKEGFMYGPKEHAFFFSWTVHSLCLYLLLSLVGNYFDVKLTETTLVFSIAIILLIVFYIIYFRNERLKKLLSASSNWKSKLFSIIATITYTGIIIYFFLR